MIPDNRRVVVLLSGGLDSSLVLKMLIDEGLEPIAVTFRTYFCLCDGKAGGCGSARKLAESLGVRWIPRFLGQEFLQIVRNPSHGYGSHMNPCIDCRILMLRNVKKMLAELGASFVATGEVLGQRPMSQHRRAMDLIERESGLTGLILRPLSAQLLQPTIPEKNGWVDRGKLLAIAGRSRKPQFALADVLGLRDYPCPAGGCLLTDPAYARKVRDLADHDRLTVEEVRLLRLGRHFRLSPQGKLVVGRNEEENGALENQPLPCAIKIEPVDVPGPVGLLTAEWREPELSLATRIVARYSDGRDNEPVKLSVRRAGETEELTLSSVALDQEAIETLRI